MKIYCPSLKRSDIATTHKYLSEAIYVVSKKEADQYKKLHSNIWAIPDEIQGNLSRVRNYVLDNSEEQEILLLDDDLKYFGRWNGNERKTLGEQEAMNMIQEGMLLAQELGVVYWGLNCLPDKGAYREYTPFGTCHYIGGPFQAHVNNPLRYDEVIFLKEDYDMTLQVLNRFRVNLRMNMYHYVAEQNTQKGGCASYRTIEREMEQNRMLQEKWGSDIVTFDRSNKSQKKKKYDINPILKIPIKGV